MEINQVRENCTLSTFASASNFTNASYYWPDNAGWGSIGAVGIGSDLTFQMYLSSSSGSITSSFWASNDPSPITPFWTDVTSDLRCSYPNTGSFSQYAVSGSSGSFMISYDNFNYYKYRIRTVVSGSNVNSIVIFQSEKKNP